MIEVANLAQVNRQIDDWMLAVEIETKQVAKGIAGFALKWIAEESPQYSGDFAANWKVGVDYIDDSFTPNATGLHAGKNGTPPTHQGHAAAVQYAVREGIPRLMTYELGNTINLSNSAFHTFVVKWASRLEGTGNRAVIADHYAWKIEDNVIKFREVNPRLGNVRERFLNYFEGQYGEITPQKMQTLINAGRMA